MAKRDCIQKRSILYGAKTSKDELIRAGEEYVSSGNLTDALNFFVRAEHTEGVHRIRDEAIRLGDAFLLGQIPTDSDDGSSYVVSGEHWRTAGENAERSGKLRFAVRAYRAAGDEERAGSLEARISGRADSLPSDDSVLPEGTEA